MTSRPWGREQPAFTTFSNDVGYDELICVRGISFAAFCGDEGLPVSGVAHVAYIPGPRLAGPSELARLVDGAVGRASSVPQLARSIVDVLDRNLEPRGAGVVVEAAHFGPPTGFPAPRWVTSAWAGCLRDDTTAPAALAALVRAHRRARGGR